MSACIMPNMYTTTYRSYFTPYSNSTINSNREYHPKRNVKSNFSLENSSLPQKQQKETINNDRLPPLNQNSTNSSAITQSSKDKPFSTKANIQRSGFWCENSVVDHQSKYEMMTTNQEVFGQPSLDMNSNNKRNKNGKASVFPSNAVSPYVREPILVPSNHLSENQVEDDTFTTTMQKSYPKYENRPVTIPSNVSMAITGFQRGSDGSINIKSSMSPPKMTKNEIERLRFRDPVAYLDAQNDNNPYVSMNQLCYQTPVRAKPF